MKRFSIMAAASLSLVAGGGCASPSGGETPVAQAHGSGDVQVAQAYGSFADWRAAFRARAAAKGVTGATFDRAFAGVTVNDRVMEPDNRHPEFTRPIAGALIELRKGNPLSADEAAALVQHMDGPLDDLAVGRALARFLGAA